MFRNRLSFAAGFVVSEFPAPAWRNWQTRWTQNPVIARSCGFEPLRRQSLLATGPSVAWCTSLPSDVCDASDGQSGPTGLMARAESLAGFAVKIFVKEHKVAPVRVVDERRFHQRPGKRR